MSTVVEQQISNIFLRLEALEATTERVVTIVDKGTPAGQYTAAVEELMAKTGWDAATATEAFNNLLNSVDPANNSDGLENK